MDRTAVARWSTPVLLVGIGVTLLGLEQPTVVTTVVVAVLLMLAWWVSPLRRAGHSHATASALAAADERVVVYWRPGCVYCARLRLTLGRLRRRALWVNIWADPEAAAFVRGVNAGDETVPTVVIGDKAVWTNPSPTRVREALGAR